MNKHYPFKPHTLRWFISSLLGSSWYPVVPVNQWEKDWYDDGFRRWRFLPLFFGIALGGRRFRPCYREWSHRQFKNTYLHK